MEKKKLTKKQKKILLQAIVDHIFKKFLRDRMIYGIGYTRFHDKGIPVLIKSSQS